jgi:ribose transport system ATP-binding protein
MGLLMRMSVRANIALGAQRELTRWGFRQRRAERQLVEKLVADLRIKTASIDTAVANLSGGNQQKVIMARLLAANSRILILDEPTKGIDVGAKAEMFKLIGDAVKRDCAVVLISSELPELLGLSDRILVLRGGEAVAEIPRERATEEAVVSAAMGVTEQEVRYVE